MERGKPFLSSHQPSTVCLLCFCYSFFNGIPSESPGLSWGVGRGFPRLLWMWPPATFIGKYKKNRTIRNPHLFDFVAHLLYLPGNLKSWWQPLRGSLEERARWGRLVSQICKKNCDANYNIYWISRGFRGSNQYNLREKGERVLAPTMVLVLVLRTINFIVLRTPGGSLLPQWASAFHIQLATWFQAKSL